MELNFFQRFVKRLFDIIVSFVGIVVLSPLILAISIIIKLSSPGEVFFRQERVGYKGKIFKIYKFRSMIKNAQNIGAGLYFDGEDDPRITKVGKFLRKTSLDEIPQLFNVLFGDMSVIGPRPLLKITTDEMSDYQRQRLNVKPGITGWAQVNGRNEISISKRIEYDIWYIENYSLILDIKIIFLTAKVVLLKEGIRMDQKPEEVFDLDKDKENK